MRGTPQPASRRRFLISGTARAASSTFTVTRTSSEPASASSSTCWTVDATSAVSVFDMDCTTTGAPPPTCTFPPARRRSRGAGGSSLPPSEVDVLQDVEVEDGHHDEEQEDEPCLQEPLLHLEREITPRNGLEERDEDLAAVEERDRQEIQDPELERENAHEQDERRRPRARRLTLSLIHIS